MNFDAGKLNDWGRCIRFVLRDSMGDVVLAVSKHMSGFHGVETAEVEACLFSFKQVIQAGYSNIIIEGDSLLVISKLQNMSNIHSFWAFVFLKFFKQLLVFPFMLGIM